MKKLSYFLLGLALISASASFSQESNNNQTPAAELSLDSGTIDSQFEFIFRRSGNYRAEGRLYEVVRNIQLEKLRQNVKDSLEAATKKEKELVATIEGNETTIESLNSELSNTKEQLQKITEEKDSVSFLGKHLSKTTYNIIMWSTVLGLFLVMLFFIVKFRQSNYLTQEAKNNLNELETEYENHRRRALEREQRISRELQDEINKYRNKK